MKDAAHGYEDNCDMTCDKLEASHVSQYRHSQRQTELQLHPAI